MIGCGRVAFIDPVLRQRRATRPPAFTLFLLIDDECKKNVFFRCLHGNVLTQNALAHDFIPIFNLIF